MKTTASSVSFKYFVRQRLVYLMMINHASGVRWGRNPSGIILR